MAIEAIPSWIFKNGISGVLVVWLFMTNARLSDVEARLYSCYEKQFVRQISDNQKKNIRHRELVAILPSEQRIKKTENEPDSEA